MQEWMRWTYVHARPGCTKAERTAQVVRMRPTYQSHVPLELIQLVFLLRLGSDSLRACPGDFMSAPALCSVGYPLLRGRWRGPRSVMSRRGCSGVDEDALVRAARRGSCGDGAG